MDAKIPERADEAVMLEDKAKRFDYAFQKKCVEARDYEALKMYVMELLMKGQA